MTPAELPTPEQFEAAGNAFGIAITILLLGGAFLVAKNVIKALLTPVFAFFRFLFTGWGK